MPLHNCPSQADLLAFVQGALSADRAAKVDAHLNTCPTCDATVSQMERQSDPLLKWLHSGAPPDAFTAEPECREAIRRAANLGGHVTPAMTATAFAQPAEAAPPERIRDYQLQEKLGEGGMGSVYVARHTRLNRLVALKILPARRMQDPLAVARFQREMEAIGRLQHPNIVRAMDAGFDEGVHYLVMEHIAGLDLSELSRRCGQLPVADACELIRQAALGLQHVHEHGFVHRDVKPSNLMLIPDGEVKILDLGLALLRSEPSNRGDLTDTGQAMGTADYMAPEQTSDSHAVDIRADIYSLGCTLYHLLAGKPPYSGPAYRNVFEKMTGHVRDPIPPIRDVRPSVPPRVADVLDRMLSKDPSTRFGEPIEVADALMPFVGSSDLGRLYARAEQITAPETSETAEPGHRATTSKHAASAMGSTSPFSPATPPPQPQTETLPWFRRKVVIGVATAMLGLLFVLGIILVIYRDGKKILTADAPPGSRMTVDREGNMTINLPDGEPGRAVSGVRPGSSHAGPATVGASVPHWGSARCDVRGTSFNPSPSTQRMRDRFLPYPHRLPKTTAPVACVRTGDLTAGRGLELVTTERDTVAAYDCWCRPLWRRNPTEDSGMVLPHGREPCCSPVVVADLDGDRMHEVAVLCGSRVSDGWNTKSPMSLVVYNGDGTVKNTFPVDEGGVSRMEPVFDFNGDGQVDLTFTAGAYRHPHSLYVYEVHSGQQLWRVDLADSPVLGGVGDVNGDGQAEILVLQDFDCHVDPPVGDYDAHHCYAVLFDHEGKRLWKQEYQHCLNGCLADLDGDGVDEIVLIHELPNEGTLHLLDAEDGEPKTTLRGLNAGIARGWSVADVTGDATKEIIVGDGKTLHVISANAERLASQAAPLALVAATNDLDGDGKIEIVARQGSSLVLYDGQLKELARHNAPGKVHEAIVSDLDGDGGNEIIYRAGEGEAVRAHIVQLAPLDAAEADVLRTHPGNVAELFLTDLRGNDLEAAADYVMPEQRDAVLASLRGGVAEAIPTSLQLSVQTRVDNAAVTVTNAPGIRLKLQFHEEQWWITDCTIPTASAPTSSASTNSQEPRRRRPVRSNNNSQNLSQ